MTKSRRTKAAKQTVSSTPVPRHPDPRTTAHKLTKNSHHLQRFKHPRYSNKYLPTTDSEQSESASSPPEPHVFHSPPHRSGSVFYKGETNPMSFLHGESVERTNEGSDWPHHRAESMTDVTEDAAATVQAPKKGKQVKTLIRPKKGGKPWSITQAEWDQATHDKKVRYHHIGLIMEAGLGCKVEPCTICVSMGKECWVYDQEVVQAGSARCVYCLLTLRGCSHANKQRNRLGWAANSTPESPLQEPPANKKSPKKRMVEVSESFTVQAPATRSTRVKPKDPLENAQGIVDKAPSMKRKRRKKESKKTNEPSNNGQDIVGNAPSTTKKRKKREKASENARAIAGQAAATKKRSKKTHKPSKNAQYIENLALSRKRKRRKTKRASKDARDIAGQAPTGEGFVSRQEFEELKERLNTELTARYRGHDARHRGLEAMNQALEAKNQALEAKNQELEAGHRGLQATNREIKAKHRELEEKNQLLENHYERLEKDNLDIRAEFLERLAALQNDAPHA